MAEKRQYTHSLIFIHTFKKTRKYWGGIERKSTTEPFFLERVMFNSKKDDTSYVS